MNININAYGLTSRNSSLSSMVNNLIAQKQRNSLSSGNAPTGGGYGVIDQTNNINSSYGDYLISLQNTIDGLGKTSAGITDKLNSLTVLKNSYTKTVSSLDDFINSIKTPTTSSIFDFLNTNGSSLGVDLVGNDINSQRLNYKVTQVATATKATSSFLKGVSIDQYTKIADLFAGSFDGKVLTSFRSDLTGSMTMAGLGITTGSLEIGGETISINGSDTVDDVVEKFKVKGYTAGFDENNKFFIESDGSASMKITNQSTNFGEVMGLTMSQGSFSLNGHELYINNDTTIKSLLGTINSDAKYGVAAIFKDNKILFVASKTGNVLIDVGKGTSNFTNAIGFTKGGEMVSGSVVLGSDGAAQKLSGNKAIDETSTGYKAGTFTITTSYNGKSQTAEITILEGETIADVIDKINNSGIGVSATVENGKFELIQNTKGSGYNITVEAGTSDFTEFVGMTEGTKSTGILSPGLDADYFTHITGNKEITDINQDNVITAGSFKINGKTIQLNGGSISSVLNEINQYSEELNIVAEYKDNHITIRNRLTGSNSLYIEGGTSNFGSVTGITTESTVAANSTKGSEGSASTLTGTENVRTNTEIGVSAIKINGTTVNIAAGTLKSAMENINAVSDKTHVAASIVDGKLVLTETRNGALPISVQDVNGNFGQITGIIGYQVVSGEEEKYGATKTILTTGKEVSYNTQIMNSTVVVNGLSINVSGTIGEALNAINAHSGATGVEAFINNTNNFVLRNVNEGSKNISLNVTSGDFGRVVGTGTYTTVDGSNSHIEIEFASVTGGVDGLDDYSQVLKGSTLTIGSITMTMGETIEDCINIINANKDKTKVEAKLTSTGQFQLVATDDSIENISYVIGGVGDFGRATGLGSYIIEGNAPDGSGGSGKKAFQMQGAASSLTGNENIVNGSIKIGNGAAIDTKGKTLDQIVSELNAQNLEGITVSIKDGKFTVLSTGDKAPVITATGDFARVTGMASYSTGGSTITNTPGTPGGPSTVITKMQGQATSLSGSMKVLNGTIKVGNGAVIDAKGKTLDQIVSELNVQGLAGVTVSITDGKFTVASTNGILDIQATGDFARVTGMAEYIVGSGSSSDVVDEDKETFTVVKGSTYQLNAAINVAGGTIKIGNGAVIDGKGKTLGQIVDEINAQGLSGITASLKDGQFTITSSGSAPTITATGDLARITGVASYTIEEGSNSSTAEKSVMQMQGANDNLTGNITILNGTIQVGSGAVINTKGKTLDQIVNEINAQGQAGITASIKDGMFTITSESGIVDITASGDFARVSGLAGYGTTGSTTSNTSGIKPPPTVTTITMVQGQTNTLTGNEKFIGGSIKINDSVVIKTNGRTLDDVIRNINNLGIEGLSAAIKNGRLSIMSTKGAPEVVATGDFARVTGLASYTITGGSTSNVDPPNINITTQQGQTSGLTGNEVMLEGSIQLGNGAVVDAKGKTLDQIVSELNAQNIEGITVSITDGKFTVVGVNNNIFVAASGDFARVAGLSSYSVSSGSSAATLSGQVSGLSGEEIALNGTLTVEGFDAIDTKGKTLNQVLDILNGLDEFITASIKDGKFTISNQKGDISVQATGDFARITGLSSYNVTSGTSDDTSQIVSLKRLQGSASSLSGSMKVVGGSVQINGGTVISTKGKTLDQIVNEINAQGIEGVTASIKDGKFTIDSTNGIPTVNATGDFARVTGMADYAVGGGTTTNTGGAGFIDPVNSLSEAEAIAQGYTVIKTVADLDAMRNNLGGKYMLMGDIDLSSYTDWRSIGMAGSAAFKGTFDGNGYTISNLKIDSFAGDATGLFGYASEAVFKNIAMKNVDINYTGDKTGGLVGSASNSTITNCYVEGTISGNSAVGGLVGSMTSTTISKSYVSGSVSGTSYTGGLVGQVRGTAASIITESYVKGSVFGVQNGTAGLVSYVDGNLDVTNSYSSASVTASGGSAAGFMGHIFDGSEVTITNCYSSGLVSGGSSGGLSAGFIFGDSSTTVIVNSFWDKEKSGQNKGMWATSLQSDPTKTQITGLTTAQMADSTNFTNAGWDTSVWDFSGATPVFNNNNSQTSSTLTGSVDTRELSGDAFVGQKAGTLTFSDGTTVSIGANDDLSTVLQKMNTAGLNASIDANGKITISKENGATINVTSDNSGVADFYGLSSVGKTYSGNTTVSDVDKIVEITTFKGQNTVTGNEVFVGGSIKIGNGAVIDTKGKTLDQVVNEINAQGLDGITASIKDGKFSVESIGGLPGIVAEGDFARVTGMAEYKTDGSSSSNTEAGSFYQQMQGSKGSLIGSVMIVGGSIKIGSGAVIDTKGKTLDQIVNEINAQGLDGITASIKDGKFTLDSTGVIPKVMATGDFARVTGMDNYSIGSSASSNGSSGAVTKIQGSTTSLTGSVFVVGGSIKIGSGAVISTKGKTLDQIVNAINAQGIEGTTASIKNGRFTIESTNGAPTVTATGDFARVAGMADYVVDAGDTTNKDGNGFVVPVNPLTEAEAIAQGYTVIKTAADLDAMRNNLGGKYILMGDIDLSSIDNWVSIGMITAEGDPGNENKLGTNTKTFHGILDGNGYEISNLKSNAGLFKYTYNAEIKNLKLTNVDVSGSDFMTGGLISHAENTVVTNVSVTGTVISSSNGTVGGLIGVAKNSQISYSGFSGDASNQYTAGGLIGHLCDSTITGSYSSGSVSGVSASGGLVGRVSSGSSVFSSHSSSTVIIGPRYYVGGLVGVNDGTIKDSYATGDVIGSTGGAHGGLVGLNKASIINSYSSSTITSDSSRIGGLVGINETTGLITNSFWDTGKSGQTEAFGEDKQTDTTKTTVTGLTTAQMADSTKFTNAGWDTSVWNFSGEAPVFQDNSLSSTLTGSVDTRELAGNAFYGQKAGTLTFSDGTTVSIGASDNLNSVLDKINAAGLTAAIDSNGKISITKQGVTDLSVTSDSSGVADFYGLSASGKTYSVGITTSTVNKTILIAKYQGSGTVSGTTAIVGGSISIGSGAVISTKGKTLDQIVNEINAQGQEGITASIKDGKFTIESTNGSSTITAIGDFARVTGMSDYFVNGGTSSNIAVDFNSPFVAPINRLSEAEAIAQGYTVIKTAADLDAMRKNLSGKYMLMGDIDLSGIADWESIGTQGSAFTGTFDGNGHKISNLTIKENYRNDKEYLGLFGYADGATIKNVGLENVDIKGADYVGGLVGRNENSTISNSYVTGSIIGKMLVGGLVGGNGNSTITNSFSTATVSGNTFTGGLVGVNGDSSTITNSFATGDIIGGVSGNATYTGGLVGANNDSIITDSYATGAVSGDVSVGGLVGWNDAATVTNSYATGSVSGTVNIGGLVGANINDAIVTNSFWNRETTGQSVGMGLNQQTDPTKATVSGLTTSQFTDSTYFTDAGWDTSVWNFMFLTLNTPTPNGQYGPMLKVAQGSILKGSVDTRELSGDSFVGQKAGTLTFSDGTTVSIGASDNLNSVLDKMNTAGLTAAIDSNGKISITKGEGANLKVTSDTSGVADFYGLSSVGKTYTGSKTTNVIASAGTSTLTGSVDTRELSGAAFGGQKAGTLTFSDGTTVSIGANDDLNTIVQKMNTAGLTAVIDSNGKISITKEGTTDLKVTSDTSGVADFYGLSSVGKTYTGSIIMNVTVAAETSTLTGSVDTRELSGAAFSGQKTGTLTFSDGTIVSINTGDNLNTVLQKMNAAGLTAVIDSNGKISITKENIQNLGIASDTTGFADFYGLQSTDKTYEGGMTITSVPHTDSTLTGSVDTREFTNQAFYGQKAGTITFSNGASVSIGANDDISTVLEKMNTAGLTATIDANGKISIFAKGTSNLTVTSDDTGFTDFYGLSSSDKTYEGSLDATEGVGSGNIQESTMAITGSVNINNYADQAFWGQKNGTLTFSNGATVSINANDTRSDVFQKIKDAGFDVSVNSFGRIVISTGDDSLLEITSDSSGFADFYGIGKNNTFYGGTMDSDTVHQDTGVGTSTITGSINVSEYADVAFWGQKAGTITFSNGKTVSVTANDSRSAVLQKIQDAGFTVDIDENGKITIFGDEVHELKIQSDTSGFSGFYGLIAGETNYNSSSTVSSYDEVTESTEPETPGTSTINAGVDTREFTDVAFWGQKNGTLTFSNGATVSISAGDTRTQVLEKINNLEGFTVSITAGGKIKITAIDTQNLKVVSDTSEFSSFYGMMSTGLNSNGSINDSKVVIDAATSTLHGSVDTRTLSGNAFYGQSAGTITFTNGTSVSITATDNLNTVIQKMKDAGLNAVIDSNGKISITAETDSSLRVSSDSTGFTDFYGLKTSEVIYSGSTTSSVIEVDNGSTSTSTLTGYIDTRIYSGDAFVGQKAGNIVFSNGKSVAINANDNLASVIQKINDAGMNASINAQGKIQITAEGTSNLSVTADSTGFSGMYGLASNQTIHSGSVIATNDVIAGAGGTPSSSTLLGAVDTRNFSGAAFFGQKSGTLTFSNGVSVAISSSDTITQVIQKMNNAGISASINSNGQISITAQNAENLFISSDSTGFADFYGLSAYGGAYSGSINLSSVTINAAKSRARAYNVVSNPNPDGGVYEQTFSKLAGSNTVNLNTQILESIVTLGYKNDAGVDVTRTFTLKAGTLADALKTINDANWYVRAEIDADNKFTFVSRAVGPFDITINMEKTDGVAGDFGRVVGMATQTTLTGDPTQQRKDAATITGGTSELYLTDQILGTNSITIWMTRERGGFTGKDTQTGSGELASVAQTIDFKDKNSDGKITIGEAIDQINEKASVTKVKASLINGQFVLTQIDNLNADDKAKYNTVGGANTAGEGDTIKYTVTGTGDFEHITGLAAYSVSGSNANSSQGTDNGYHYHAVVESTVKNDGGTIKSGYVNLNGTNVDVSGLSIQGVIDKINNQYSNVAVAGWDNGNLVIQLKTASGTSSSATGTAANISATGDAARVLGLASYNIGAGFVSAGVYSNYWRYNYDIWSQKTDDWDLTKDYSGYDTYSSQTQLQYKTTFEYKYQEEIWKNVTWNWSTTKSTFTGADYRSTAMSTSTQTTFTPGTTTKQETISGYYAFYTSTIYSECAGSVWISGHSQYLSSLYSNKVQNNCSDFGTKGKYLQQGIDRFRSQLTDMMNGLKNAFKTKVRNAMGSTVYDAANVNSTIDSGFSAVYNKINSQYTSDVPTTGDDRDDYDAAIGYHTLVFDRKTNKEGRVAFNYYNLVGDIANAVRSQFGNGWFSVSAKTTATITTTATTFTTWYSGTYQQRTQKSAWTTLDTGYNAAYNKSNTIADCLKALGYSSTSASPPSGSVIQDPNNRIRSTAVQNRTWFKETYWTKDRSTSYDTANREGYYGAPGFQYSVGLTYRNVSSTHVVTQYTNGSISASTSYDKSSFGSNFAGQIGGTITINSSYFGNIGSFNYSSGTSINSILQSIKNQTGINSVTADGTYIVTDGYYGKVTISDTGNAAKLLGIATSGTSGSSSRTNKSDDDWNGITKKTDNLTGSRTDLYNNFNFALQKGGSFDLYLGTRKLKTITYTEGSSIQSILNQMQGTYIYDTGKNITDPFSDKIYDDRTYDTSGTAYTDSSGRIFYTASYSATLDSSGRIVLTSDVYNSSAAETLSVKNDSGNFTALAGLTSTGHSYAENNNKVIESYGYDRLSGSVDNLTRNHILGNLKSETFQITGGNGTYDITINSGDSIQTIIDKIFQQSGGHYKAGLFDGTEGNYDNAVSGKFYIESTIQTPTDTQVTSTDLTRRLGLVSVNESTGPSSQTETGDQGYFRYENNGGGVYGMKANSIFTGLKNGKMTFTLHARQSTGESGSITYRPDMTYTIDIEYNDTVSNVLNKMKNAIMKNEDEIWEHDDVIDENRLDRLDFKVNYDEATNLGSIFLQIAGNYASEITFDDDTSGFVQMAGLAKTVTEYDPNFTTEGVSSGKAMQTGSLSNLNANHIFGNQKAGTMTITAGDATKTINITETDRIQDVIDKINEGGIFVAGLDSLNRFYIKTAGQNTNNISVSGTSDFHSLVGLKGSSWTSSTTTELGTLSKSKITGSVYGLATSQTFNNMTSGTFSLSAAGHKTLDIAVTKGVTSVGDVLNFINNSADSDFTASLDESGRIVISTKISNGAAIRVNDGTTNFAKVLGLTSGTLGGNAVGHSGSKDIYSTLSGSTIGLDQNTRFSAGDFVISVTNPSGAKTTKTFTLSGNETLSDVANMISNSDLGLSAVLDSYTNNLVLRSKTAGEFKIELKDGTSNFAETTGFTKNGAQIQPSDLGSLSTLTSSKTAQSAQALGFSAGNFFISLVDTNGNVTSTKRIDISKYDTIDTIISQINNAGLGVNAVINAEGKMVITRTATTSAGGISITKGTSDFTNKIGFTSGGTLSSSAQIENGENATHTVVQSNVLAANNPSDSLGSLGITDGNFKINGQNINVKANDNITSLLSKINSAFNSADPNGVYAQYINNRIVLTSNNASADSRINIEAGTTNLTDKLGLTSNSAIDETSQEKGQNAKININGKDIESNSNIVSLDKNGNLTSFNSTAEAIRLTVKEIGSGTVDIGKKSVSDAYDKLNNFVNKFNAAMTMSQSSNLNDDAVFTSMLQQIKKALTDNVGNTKQITKELSSIGINIYISGGTSSMEGKVSISLNKDKFINAYLDNPDKIKSILIGNDSKPLDYAQAGTLTRLRDTLYNSVKSDGYFSNTMKFLEDQNKSILNEIALNTAELNNIKMSLSLGDNNFMAGNQGDLSAFLAQLDAQYRSVNDLIQQLSDQYNQSVTRLVLNPMGSRSSFN